MTENWNNLPEISETPHSVLQEETAPVSLEETHLEPVPSNIPLGFIGAVLGALIGCVAWVIVYQLGFIAAICGILMAFLAMKGYEKLGKTLDKTGIILSVIVVLGMVYVAAYLSVVTSVYLELAKEYSSFTVKGAFDLTRLILANDPQAKAEFIKELATSYGLSVLGAVGFIIRKFKQTK